MNRQLEVTLKAGARILGQGRIPEGPGYFFPATVLGGVSLDSPAAREELFGPVAPLFRAESEAQALDWAQATPFGLGASFWTRDPERVERQVRGFPAGTIGINTVVHSDPRLPFGGIRDSGYGRELGGEGVREFLNLQSVFVNG